ncbi:MAG: ABC transporter substrate-binding protein [Dehalococcoidia bacterium]|nr:ABC transporter substrate-binding protein [Dehalococcoidia bacterium]
MKTPVTSSVILLATITILLTTALGCDVTSNEQPSETPLRIGLLLNFTGSPEASADRQRAFELAIQHVNEGGGVLGMPVEGVTADATQDPAAAVEAARRLVEVEGVHAIVGPNASSASLPVSQNVSGTLGIPTISPSATSPQLTGVEDSDYFFRTALSDAAQGPVLARVTRERGFDSAGLIYQDDAYGQGLADSFEEAWDGTLQVVSVAVGQTGFLPELEQSASAGAQALVVIAFEDMALSIVREAIDTGTYDEFVFGDAAKRASLVREIGGEKLGDMYGTAGASSPANTATADWEAAFIAEYGELPVLAYVKETYDATVALALAAQAAGSLEGAAIRDHLRDIGAPPGRTVVGTPEGVADGLSLLAEGQEIDFDGAASTLDWDESGDLRRGYIGVWRFTSDGRIEELDTVFFEN